jgi:hypothetical protein
MWNLSYGNRKCNEYERIREHRMHLERIVTVKPSIDYKEPKKPTFLAERAKKEKMEEGKSYLKIIENRMKINYENNVLLKKIIEIEQKPSAYHPYKMNPKRCPAFDDINKNYRNIYEKSKLDNQNLVK